MVFIMVRVGGKGSFYSAQVRAEKFIWNPYFLVNTPGKRKSRIAMGWFIFGIKILLYLSSRNFMSIELYNVTRTIITF